MPYVPVGIKETKKKKKKNKNLKFDISKFATLNKHLNKLKNLFTIWKSFEFCQKYNKNSTYY